jgi:hypothetical protein
MIEEFLNKIHNIIVPDKSTLEVEMRLMIDSRKKYDVIYKSYGLEDTISIAKGIISYYKEKVCKIEQSINFMNESLIKQLIFVNGE